MEELHSLEKMSKSQLYLELIEGLNSLNKDEQFSAEDIDKEFDRKYKNIEIK